MVYQPNMPKAAYRHLVAAEHLLTTDRWDVAGYLFGIAAECAIKRMLVDSGVAPKGGRDPLFYSHFPELITLAQDALKGRKSSVLMKIFQKAGLMQGWAISMRYSSGKTLKKKQIEVWAKQARDMVSAMGTVI